MFVIKEENIVYLYDIILKDINGKVWNPKT